MLILLATTAAQKRHLQEIGLIVCGVGALAILLSGAFGLRSMSRAMERSTMIVAGLLLGVGFLIQVLALHSSK
jgi:preprotein translocase subunit SecG